MGSLSNPPFFVFARVYHPPTLIDRLMLTDTFSLASAALSSATR